MSDEFDDKKIGEEEDLEELEDLEESAEPEAEKIIAKELIEEDIIKELHKSYLEYSMSVIVARALPDVRDGLKPVQRRILKAMDDLHLVSTKETKKSAKIAGDTSGNYHPHGEAIIYPAMVRMAQDFNARYPLIKGQGNMGSIDGDPPAAMRYTEMKMSKYSEKMLEDLDKDTVEWVDNYDASRKEPKVLPSLFPNMLANGTSGIAVGMATNIPPHNLRELCDGINYYIDHEDCSISDLMNFIKGPDFPTYGLIQGISGIREAYETGRGSIVMKAVCSIDETSDRKPVIYITELPYQVNKQALVMKIAKLAKDKKIEGIADIQDHSNKDGMRIQIECKKDSHPEMILRLLMKHTELKKTFGVNMLALVDGVPKILNLKEMIMHYVNHRRKMVYNRNFYNLRNKLRNNNIIEGLIIANDNIDEVIKIIRESNSANEARIELMNRFSLSWVQASAILNMQLRQLAGLERKNLENEFAQNLRDIAEYEDLLSTPAKIDKVIKNELIDLAKTLGDDRRTKILGQEEKDLGKEDFIPHEQLVVTITRQNYIKKVSADIYKAQSRTSMGKNAGKVKIDDDIAYMFVCESHDNMLFFTDKGKVYKEKVSNMSVNTSREAQGKSIRNFINIDGEENVNAILTLSNDEIVDVNKFLIFGTVNGEVKRVSMDKFQHIRTSGLKVFDIEDDDTLRFVEISDGCDDVIMVTKNGQSIRFNESIVRSSGRVSGGVRGIKLKGDDKVVSMCLAKEGQEGKILCVTELGLGKQTSLDEYTVHNRGGMGNKVMKCTEKTGNVIGAAVVYDDYEFFVVNAKGKAKRLKTKLIRETSRTTQGVKVYNLKENETLISMSAFKKIDFNTDDYKDPNSLDIYDPNIEYNVDDTDDFDETDEIEEENEE